MEESTKTLQQQFQEMNDTDLAFWYQCFFTIVDGLLAENQMLEMGGSFAKTEKEADRYVDDYSYNKDKITHYQGYIDYMAQILNERAKKYDMYNPISEVYITEEEKKFYEDSSLVSLFCNFQMFSAVVAEIQKVEKLITNLQMTIPGSKNETALPRVWRFHISFVVKMKQVLLNMLQKMAKQ